MTTFEPLDIDRIEAARQGAVVGRKVVVFASTASTNDIAWQYAANPAHHGLCVLAEVQTRGRGRRGRTWHSRPGESILCSILLIDPAVGAELLTLTAAVAAAEAIGRVCGTAVGIKWPNDLLADGRKLAGILVEKRTVAGRACFVVGIGVNCNQTAEAFEGVPLRIPATSLRIRTGRPVDRTTLICALLDAFEQWLAKAGADEQEASGPVGTTPPSNPVIDRWTQLSTLLGRQIAVECDGQTYRGFCRGIDPIEGLIVQLDAGSVRAFEAAHTTILSIS